ncbi:MAG: hypothetical protein KF845_13625 [Cyclobacteriaceae bacterium]|nr:hypothetical protein [Cyclobacteriaceae bacterium]
MNPAVRKWVIRPVLIVMASLVVIAAIVFTMLTVQQERIVNVALAELNKNFTGELIIQKSSVSPFRNFPYVSIALHHGRMFPDKTKTGNPIYEFNRLYIGFSVNDLLNGHYKVKRFLTEGGYLNVVKESDGNINLLEALTQPDTTRVQTDTTAILVVELEKIILKNMNVSYLDKGNGRKISAHIDKILSSFSMDSAQLRTGLEGDFVLDIATDTATTLFSNKKIHLSVLADYRLHSKLLEVKVGKVKLQEADFDVTGYADVSDTTEVNFNISGDKQNFNLLTAFIPEDVKENLKPFQYSGRLFFDAVINGKITENEMPHIQINFECEDAWFLNTEANKRVDRLGFKGYYTNGSEHSLKTSEIRILNVSAQPEKGIFKGHFVIRDFTNPQAVAKINSELELKFLGEFFGIPDLKQMTGTINLEMDFNELHDIQLPEESLSKLKEGIQSKLVVEDLSFHIPKYPHVVQDVNIRAEMIDGKITIDSATFRVGESDFEFSGSLSDVRAFLREHEKLISLVLNFSSKQVKLNNLLAYDTVLAKKWNEELHDFNIGMALETTVQQLLHPSPLPKGTFIVKNLRGVFKNYSHTFKDLAATVVINDTLLRVRDFTGMIDSSDIDFRGRITNYQLWFTDIKKGKTQIAFDFKSNRFAFRDVLSRKMRQEYIPRGYRREELTNVWLRAKIDLTYDTIFRFARASVANVSANLKLHNLKLYNINGGFKYGSKILALDTLRGKIGNSDFDITMKYYFKGVDRYDNKVASSLNFKSQFLDVDEISKYDLALKTGSSRRNAVTVPDSVRHAEAFNIFMIPFSDFNAEISIGKMKYNRLWMKDFNTRLTMQQDQTLTVDTLIVKITDGAIRMRGKFSGSNPEKIFFRSNIVFEDIDLGKMLLKFDHFGQDVVVNKNVKGRLSGSIRSYVRIHPDLVPVMSNTRAEMNLKIYNGSLVDFAPMQALGSYFKDKNLNMIRFDTLQNKLTFTNGVLEIPAMSINSSLGYIQISGRQSLDLNMEYYLRIPMKMVTKVGLSSLFNNKQDEVDINQVDEIDVIDKDKKIAFMNLKLTGTPENYKIGLGKNKEKKVL